MNAQPLTRRVTRPVALLAGVWDYRRRPELSTGFGGPFNGQARRLEAITAVFEALEPEHVIETGTYRGTTTDWFRQRGIRVDTIEVNWRLCGYARARFRRDPLITVHRGDSRAVLPRLARTRDATRRCFFYLDAHWNAEFPTREEIEIITTRWEQPIIVIDDCKVPWDDGYGFDDYGAAGLVSVELLPDLPGWSVFLPSTPHTEETGARRGCALIVPAGLASRARALVGWRELSS